MSTLDSRELSRDEFPQWDELVDSSLHGTIFHKTGWLEASARALEKKVKIFGCFQNGLLVGGCSLFIHKKYAIVPIAIATCTLTHYGGFVIFSSPNTSRHKQESVSGQVIESLIDRIKKEHFFFINIQHPPEFLDIRPFTRNGWRSRVSYTYYLNLTHDIESSVDNSIKKSIRKAEKNRISIEPFSDISRYYDLFCETYRRKNLDPPCEKRLFTELYSFIRTQNCGEMMAARTPDDEIASADIVIWDNKKAYRWSSASDFRFLNTGAPTVMKLHSFERCRERGIPQIDLMTANVEQLSQFTAHLNPILAPCYGIKHWLFDDILNRKT